MLEPHAPVVSSLCLGSARRQAFSPIGTIDLPRSGGAFFMRSCRVLDTATNGWARRFIGGLLLMLEARSRLLRGVSARRQAPWRAKHSPAPMAGLFAE